MNTLPDDVIMYMALVMEIPDVLELCNSNSRFNKIICNNQVYWMNKLLNDFPEDFNADNITEYGPDYKTYYRSHAYKTINLNITLDQYNEEAGDYEFINGQANLTYHRNRDPRPLLFAIYNDVFTRLGLWGRYTVYINEDEVCDEMSYIEKECFESVNNNTTSVTVNLASQDFIDETDYSLSYMMTVATENVRQS